MRKRSFDVALVGGFFCIMFVFLFTAITYAECAGGDICVDSPGTGDELVSGDASWVNLTIDPTAPRYATQYRLYACCCSGLSCTPNCTNEVWGRGIITLQMCDPNAARFSERLGDPKSGCPETYFWEVPFVEEPGKTCMLGAVLLDANFNPIPNPGGHVIDYDVGDEFKIKPFGTPVVALSLTPGSKIVGPGGPGGGAVGKANYEITGGVQPFKVTVLNNYPNYPPAPAVIANITINGSLVWPPLTFYGPSEFTVSNKVSEPCTDNTLTVVVRDSTPTTVTSTYNINCLH